MKLTDKQKHDIEQELNEWQNNSLIATKSKDDKQHNAQFFTPTSLTIRMIEKFDSVKDKDILDPACGDGNLLVACILCGADPNRIYGIELDPEMVEQCRKRLAKFGVLDWHIHQGDALLDSSYDFSEDYVMEQPKCKGNNNKYGGKV